MLFSNNLIQIQYHHKDSQSPPQIHPTFSLKQAKVYPRFKPKSSINKVDIPPQHDLALFS